MGRSSPLDHPELREVAQLLDRHDVAEAQRLLAQLGTRRDLEDGVAFLTTRLLHARGRLDIRGVADRLRDLVSRSADFPEATALLARAEAGQLSSRPAAPGSEASGETAQVARASKPPPGAQPPSVQPTVRASPRAPRPSLEGPESSSLGPSPMPRQATPAWHPSDRPGPPAREGGHRASQVPAPAAEPGGRRRNYTPISGFEPHMGVREQGAGSEPPVRHQQLPDIPRAPALPVFKDNGAPPSYAPHRSAPELEPFRSKSLLPHNAGRYSAAPAQADVLDAPRRRPSRIPGRSSAPPPSEGGPIRQTVPHTPDRRRSAGPGKSSPPLPTLFEIASWIDQGRHRDAIAAINRAGPDAGADYAVLRARALAGAGYVDQALDALEKLEAMPTLDPELSAACARLFVELGDPSRALLLAKHALDAAPDRPLIRLTYALAAVRTARRTPGGGLLDQAERTLERLQGREGPLPALYQALKACIQAGAGDAERAISMAQRALGLDPKSPDGLAAVVEASARLGRVHDARQAWTRLNELSPAEAEPLAHLLGHAGAPAGEGHGHGHHPAGAREIPLWAVVETELASGNRTEAIRAVEGAAHEAVRRMTKSASQSGMTAVATVAASFFTTTPVLSSFAPFDLSLWSIRRVEACLDVLYGADRRPRLPTEEAGLILLLGAYLGETLRLAHGGHWEGGLADLDGARVVVKDRSWFPFRIIATRLRQGRRAPLGDAISAALAKPGTEPWQARIANPVAPPVPWAPRAWPRPSQAAAIGRSLAGSPIGRYCEDFAEGPLDRTTASLIALDTYLDLVAPHEAASDSDAAWTRRVAMLAGAYVGETLRELIGAEWVYGVDAAEDALAFRLKLRGTAEATPVAHVLERLIGERSSSLVDYAKTLIRRAGAS